MPNPLDKLLGRDTEKGKANNGGEGGGDDGDLKELFADARRRRGLPPERFDHDVNNDDDITAGIESFFSQHPFFGGGRHGGGISNESPSSLFENMILGATHSSSYQIRQDDKEVTIDVDLPGVTADDLKVEVLQNIQSCMVQWSGERRMQKQQRRQQKPKEGRGPDRSFLTQSSASFQNRLRLGPQVDCDHLTANLSHGILTMRAPVKNIQEDTSSVRSIPITEDQN